MKEPVADKGQKDLVELNADFFTPYFIEQGWRLFIDKNLLKIM